MTDFSVVASGKFRLGEGSGMQDNSVAMAEKNKLDPARQRLLELADKAGESLSGLSVKLGKNRSYLENFVRKGSPRELAYEDRTELARLLDAAPEELAVVIHNQTLAKRMVAGMIGSKLSSQDRDKRSEEITELTEPVPLIGETQSGAWREAIQFEESERPTMYLEPNEEYRVYILD